MAKKIFYHEEEINNVLKNVKQQITSLEQRFLKRCFKDDKDREVIFKIQFDNGCDGRHAILEFTQVAWIKMRALVDSFSGEVQWHGTVERKSNNEFIVKDILVFPHETTSTTVVSEQKDYEKWLNGLDDETFSSCRFHGHSHVDMSVCPSGVDMKYRHELVDHMGTPTPNVDLFYIFLITNKKGDISAEIYDLTMNALYSSQEILIKVPLGGGELSSFIRQAKSCVKERSANSSGLSYNRAYTAHKPLAGYNRYPNPIIYDDEYDDDFFEEDDNI